jgi:hypothetical protein
MAEVLSDITQVQYVHPSNATTSHIAPVDASPRFIAVPPVTGTNGPRSSSSNVIVRPTSLSVLRQNNPFYLRFDAAADSRYGGYVPNDVLINYPIHPSVNTISFTAVNGTDQLIANWNHGD